MKKELKNKGNKTYTAEELKKIAEDIQEDFLIRQTERKPFEAQWQLNLNFLLGNQYCAISPNGDIEDYDKQYFWQEREVFNHITPILESRMSKLNRVRPTMTVIPASADEKDLYTAKVSKQIIEACKHKLNLSELTTNATLWSEITGTVFYKIIWNNKSGKVIGKSENGEAIYEGDVDICICPPYEIYPDNISANSLDDCQSIIHARAYDVKMIETLWGVEVAGEDINVFSLDSTTTVGGLGYSTSVSKACAKVKKNHAVVLEKYELPTEENPNGKLTIICGDKVLYIGELPYINKIDNKRGYPFVKQNSNTISGNFWGVSVIERSIPIQRAYNAIKNRKHEFLNRLSMGVLTVEDGSVDIDNLIDEGISPGKVLVYRQGSNPPSYMANGKVPIDFTYEEERLLQEFILISGVSDLMRNSQSIGGSLSGTALQLLIEQDDSRLSHSAENIRIAQREIASQILRLYKQFSITSRVNKLLGADGTVEMFYFKSSDISSDDIVFETENEMGETLAQKRNMVFELLKSGLLHDEEGKLSNSMRLKVLDLLGFGIWQGTQDITSLHTRRADNENIEMLEGKKIEINEIDDHKVHITEHTTFMLSSEYEMETKNSKSIKEIFLEHIKQHKIAEQLTQSAQRE